jgi:hypothetical protein
MKPLYNGVLKIYFSSSSKTRCGRNFANTPKVIQKGTIKPKRNNNNQKAIPPIKMNNTIPKILITKIICVTLITAVKIINILKKQEI